MAAQYNIYTREHRDGTETLADTVAAPAGSHTLAGLPANFAGYIRVEAESAGGTKDGESGVIGRNLVQVITDASAVVQAAKPNKPADLFLVPGISGSMTVTFRYDQRREVVGATSFKVYAGDSEGSIALVETITVTHKGQRMSSLLGRFDDGATVICEVEALSSGGVSSGRVRLSGTADASAPTAPSSLTVEVA